MHFFDKAIVFSILLALNSCSDEESIEPSANEASSFRATIDGKEFNAGGQSATLQFGVLSLFASASSTKDGVKTSNFMIDIPEYTGSGSYASPKVVFSFSEGKRSWNTLKNNNKEGDGRINVEEKDGFVRGTFSFRASGLIGGRVQKKAIEAGKFRIKLRKK